MKTATGVSGSLSRSNFDSNSRKRRRGRKRARRCPASAIPRAIQNFLRRDCIQSPHPDVMLPKPEKMKILKNSIGDGRILICVALLFANAGLFIFSPRPKSKSEAKKTPANVAIFDNPLALVLGSQTGESRTDREISRLQQRIREGRNVELWL